MEHSVLDSSGALVTGQPSSVLLDPALLSLCFLHIESSQDFRAAGLVCKTWRDCLRPENTPLWLGFLQRHLTRLPLWEHASRGPGNSWKLLPDENDEYASKAQSGQSMSTNLVT